MSTNRLRQLHEAGQSVWLDFIDRAMLRDGSLQKRIREDSLRGMTSNPSIFEKALAEGKEYDAQIESVTDELSPSQLFELVETDDVRAACDIFADVYRESGGTDGFVSIEVSPGVAADADATVEEARRLWAAVDRPNVMVKVPGTPEGAMAVRKLITEGINVNITLLFSIEAHALVIEAYLAALEERAAAGLPIDHIASVASFFVSRVDSEIDKRLEAIAASSSDALRDGILAMRGKAAIANAKLAYRLFTRRFSGERWAKLAALGAKVQRPLWASTSAKNPAYRDVIYVETLIGPDTVNTMPPATIEAFRDHGVVARTVDQDFTAAEQFFHDLEQAGVSMDDVTGKLLADGLASFQKSFDTLIQGLERKAKALGKTLVRA
ncbi:MAG: transaldolase [Gemmatimonadaceae bacterium]